MPTSKIANFFLDTAQGASNAAASAVSGPVDALAWGLGKAGVPMREPMGGSTWMARQGLTAQPRSKVAQVMGETAGMLSPAMAAAKAPQIAAGLLQAGRNAVAPSHLGPLASQRGVMNVEFRKDPNAFREIDLEGDKIVVRWPGFGESAGELRDRVRDKMVEKLAPKYDHFFRFTNNKEELKLLAAGALRPSVNHMDDVAERGLSVAAGPHYSIHGYKYAYPVKGDVVGKGSDGEPVLAMDTIKPLVKRLVSSDRLVAKDRALMARAMAEHGLPNDFFSSVNFLNDPFTFAPK